MSEKALWTQATHTLKLIDQQNPSPEDIKKLHDGLLTDLVQAIMGGILPSRDKVREFYGLEASVSDGMPSNILTVDYSQPLEQMIALGNYGDNGKGDNYNKDITSHRFPIVGEGKVDFEWKLSHFGRRISSEDVVEKITALDTPNPWEVGKIEHVTAFGAKYPEEQRKYPIVGLGSVAEVCGDRRVPALHTDGGGRRLGLDHWEDGWPASCRFLLVRRIVTKLSVA